MREEHDLPLLVAWARTGRMWTVPLGVAISFPVPYLGWLAVLGLV